MRLKFENRFVFVTYIAISDGHDFFNRIFENESNYLKRVLDDTYISNRKIIFLNTNVSIYNIFFYLINVYDKSILLTNIPLIFVTDY